MDASVGRAGMGRLGGALAASRSPFESPAVLAALALVAIIALYDPRGLPDVVARLKLPDTDDAMRLSDVRALVAGQDWYDLVQHRFLPPAGVLSHWSRLVDAPFAGLILALTPLLGPRLAEGVAAAAWPALTFAAYAATLFLAMRRAFGPAAAWIALFVAAQTGPVVSLFAWGRIDHHNVQLCALAGAVVALARPGFRPATLAGALAGLSLAVGLETLPYIAVLGAVLAALWAWRGAPEAARLAGFGLSLAATAPLLFAAQTAPALWPRTACDALSPPWLWLTTGAGLAGLLPLSPTGRRGRLLATAGLGAGLAAGFAALFPACLAGPFAHLPPVVIENWLHKVAEAMSFKAHLAADPRGALANAMPVLVCACAAPFLAGSLPEGFPRRLVLLCAAMLATGAAIAQVQLRGVYVSSAFVPVVGALLLERAFAALRDPAAAPLPRLARLGLGLAAVGGVWAAVATLPGWATKGSEAPAAEDRAERSWRDCTGRANLKGLAALPPGLVLAPIDLGPSILLHTPHAVVAAPYHRAGDGLLAGLESFGGDEAAMRGHAARLGADYVLVCKPLQRVPDDRQTPSPVPFAGRLARGEAPPPWLARAEDGAAVQVWRVRKGDATPRG